MTVLTVNGTGQISVDDLRTALGYAPNQSITLNDIELRMLARATRAGSVSLDAMHGAVRISTTGTAGSTAAFLGWSSGVVGSLAESVTVKGALLVEIGQSTNNTCDIALYNAAGNPGANWIHGVSVIGANQPRVFAYASEANYFFNANTNTAFWSWNGGWNMTTGTGFQLFIYY